MSGFRKTGVYPFNRYTISCVGASATPYGQGRVNVMTTGAPIMWWIDYIISLFQMFLTTRVMDLQAVKEKTM